MGDRPYTYTFSHEFEAGTSGPARSYWLLHGPGAGSHCPPICLHHRDGNNPEMAMASICDMMNVAFQEGQKVKAHELRLALGIK